MTARHKKTAEFLSQVPFFSSLPENEIRDAARHLSEARYPQGRVLIQSDAVIDRVLIVKTGTVSLYYPLKGRRMLGGTLKRGEVFGGLSILLNGGISFRTVEAASDLSLYEMDKERFLDLSSRYPTIYNFFAEAFTRRMQDESHASMMSTHRALDFLRHVVPFSFLPASELEHIAPELTILRHPKETMLLLQDRSKLENVYMIQQGAVERYYEKPHKKILSGMLGEGDIFGGISLLLNEGISARTVKTVEETCFYLLSRKRFLDICRNHTSFSEFFTDTFGKGMLDRSYAEIFKKRIQPKEESHRFFNQTIDTIVSGNLVTCDADSSVQAAARLMSDQQISSIFVRGKNSDIVGMVTDNDLRQKVVAGGLDITTPVSQIMSAPLTGVSSKALVFEGVMAMMLNNYKHLAVTDASGRIVGVVTNKDLLTAQGKSPVFLIREINSAESVHQISDKFNQVPKLIQSLINSGAKAKNVTRMITTISDAILNKIIRFSLDDLGPPPARFAFMIMGSEGRSEQTLKTDQDNAIVYEDADRSQAAEINDWFLRLGEKVCNHLDRAGYAFCTGDVMAKNPKWCGPLSRWEKYFSDWIHAASPEDLLHSSIFFDFRYAYGDGDLVARLRAHLFRSLEGWEGFFRHLTENALRFKPPLGFFRNFVVESKGEHRNAFDIKTAMMPIVDFVRIYALKNHVAETNTLERLHQLLLNNIITREEYHEMEQAYSFLMQLRFVRQVTAVIEEGEPPDNYINPKKLSGIEQKMLKEIFKRIEKFQVKLEFDFTGEIGVSG